MIEHTFITNHSIAEVDDSLDLCEFKASLAYISSSRPARPCLKKSNKKIITTTKKQLMKFCLLNITGYHSHRLKKLYKTGIRSSPPNTQHRWEGVLPA